VGNFRGIFKKRSPAPSKKRGRLKFKTTMNKEEFKYTFSLLNRINRQLGIVKAQNDIILKEIAKTNEINLDEILKEVNDLDAKYLHQYLEDNEHLFQQAFGIPKSDS